MVPSFAGARTNPRHRRSRRLKRRQSAPRWVTVEEERMCLEWSRGLERARYLAGVETMSNEMSFQEHARSACAVPIKSDPSMCRPFALSTELRMNRLATDVGNDCSLGHRGAHHRYRRKRRDEEGDCNHHPNQLGKIKGPARARPQGQSARGLGVARRPVAGVPSLDAEPDGFKVSRVPSSTRVARLRWSVCHGHA